MDRASRLSRVTRLRTLVLALTLLCMATAGSAAVAHIAPGDPAMRTVPVGNDPLAIGVDGRTGRVFVANYDGGTVSMLDARSGVLVRTVKLGHYPTVVAVDEADARVFTLNDAIPASPESNMSGGSTLSVLDARSGALIRSVPIGPNTGSLAVDRRTGHLFLANTGDDTMRLLDARSGLPLRTVALSGGVPQALAVDTQTGRAFVGSTGGQGSVDVLDTRTGQTMRTLQLGRSVRMVLAAPGVGRVLVAGDGLMRLLDARSGALLHTLKAPLVPLLVDEPNQRVLAWSAAGLRLLDARSGAPRGPLAIDGRSLAPVWPEDVALDTSTGRIVVAAQFDDARGPAGRLFVLDGRSGRVVRTLPLDTAPSAVAVDARTHHAFVITQNPTDMQTATDWVPWLTALGRRWAPWLPLPWAQQPAPHGSMHILDLS